MPVPPPTRGPSAYTEDSTDEHEFEACAKSFANDRQWKRMHRLCLYCQPVSIPLGKRTDLGIFWKTTTHAHVVR